MQSGSWLLDADLQPVTNDLSRFLDWADVDAPGQDMELLLSGDRCCQSSPESHFLQNVTYTGAWTDNNWHISAYAWETGLFVPYDPQRHRRD